MPELHANLLSVPCLTKQGLGVTFDENTCTILANGKVVVLVYKQNSLYILQVSSNEVPWAYIMQGPSPILNTDKPCINMLASKVQLLSASLETWHCRLGHLNVGSVLKLAQKDMVNGMDIEGSNSHNKSTCKACLEGKQHRNPILTKSSVENTRVLHWTYSDVCSPMETMACSSY